MSQKKQIDKIYGIIFVVVLVSVIIRTFGLSDLGILNSDPISYFINAYYLPEYDSSVFPIGYSLILKLVNFLTSNYLIASKIIAISTFVLTLIFSWKKNFYFKETVILFSFASVMTLFIYSISETVFIPLLYYYIYLRYQQINNSVSNYLPVFVTFLLLIFTRYFGIFLMVSEFAYFILLFINDKKNSQRVKNQCINIALLGIAFIVLATYNLIMTGDIAGEDKRVHLIRDWGQTARGLIMFFNPFIVERDSTNILTFLFSYGTPVLVILYILYIIYKSKKNWSLFYKYTLLTSIILFLLLFISSLVTRLQALGYRLLAPITLFFFFGFLVHLNKQKLINYKKAILLPLISVLIFNFYTNKNFIDYFKATEYYNQKIGKVANCKDVILETNEKNKHKTSSDRNAISYILFQYRIDHNIPFNKPYRVRNFTDKEGKCTITAFEERHSE